MVAKEFANARLFSARKLHTKNKTHADEQVIGMGYW